MQAASGQLLGMPEPHHLEKVSSDGTLIFPGPYGLRRYQDDDIGLRNRSTVSLRKPVARSST